MKDKKTLNKYEICDPEQFDKLVSIKIVDMNNIPDDIKGYDFCWSSCSYEHLGSIENGLKFVENSLKTLKPGWIAIHTSEYNVNSNTNTVTHDPQVVIFRRSDMEELQRRFYVGGHESYFNLNHGTKELDVYVDLPPYKSTGDFNKHIKITLAGYIVTSFGIIIKKNFELN